MGFALFLRLRVFLLCLGCPLAALCQALKPGLKGTAPSQWITFKNTHAFGRAYDFGDKGVKTFTQEELYVRAWVPVFKKEKLTVILGPHYRTEKWELKSSGENPIPDLAKWKLRTYGVDIRALVSLNSSSWLVLSSNFNKSGNYADLTNKQIPLNYTFSTAYLKRYSENKEAGFGVLVNKSYKLTVLPAFIFNYNFSDDLGIELMLPKSFAIRKNLSANDILNLKAESVTRTYYIKNPLDDGLGVCRRVDIDMGMSYNKKLGNYAGFEIFGGYRKMLTNKLVHGATPINNSGLTFTAEFYVQPPQLRKRH